LRDAFNSLSLICLNFSGVDFRTSFEDTFLVACTLFEAPFVCVAFFIYDKDNGFSQDKKAKKMASI
jgi:hypothetical protein